MSNIDRLAWAALKADLEQKEAKKKADELKKKFIQALEEQDLYHSDTKAVGNVRTKITANRFFNLESAEEMVDEDTLEKCKVTVTDAKLLKNHLNKNQIEEAMESYDNPFKLQLEVLRD